MQPFASIPLSKASGLFGTKPTTNPETAASNADKADKDQKDGKAKPDKEEAKPKKPGKPDLPVHVLAVKSLQEIFKLNKP